MNNTAGLPEGFIAEDAEKLIALWASKFQLHKKEYGRKSFRKPRLAAGVTRRVVHASSPAEQAEYWFFIENTENVGSFLWLCNMFELDVDRVRTKVQPLWRELYGECKPVGIKEKSKAVLQNQNTASAMVT